VDRETVIQEEGHHCRRTGRDLGPAAFAKTAGTRAGSQVRVMFFTFEAVPPEDRDEAAGAE
jgi:hypothetical protein